MPINNCCWVCSQDNFVMSLQWPMRGDAGLSHVCRRWVTDSWDCGKVTPGGQCTLSPAVCICLACVCHSCSMSEKCTFYHSYSITVENCFCKSFENNLQNVYSSLRFRWTLKVKQIEVENNTSIYFIKEIRRSELNKPSKKLKHAIWLEMLFVLAEAPAGCDAPLEYQCIVYHEVHGTPHWPIMNEVALHGS